MSISFLELQAKALADKLRAKGIGFDPATILIVWNLLSTCWTQEHESDPAMALETLKRKNEHNPKTLRTLSARRIFWNRDEIRNEAGEPVTRDQAYTLADQAIEHALTQDAATVHACCCEATWEDNN